ncbi:MAG: DUF2520 domain-containing protein [Ignavibacteria bacterium]|nr:DUF2520 domain-containing protein [Ignavibacteria bacterium]
MKATIIGFGKLGKAISFKLFEKNLLATIVSKHFPEGETNIENFKNIVVKSLKDLKEIPEVIFLTTSDSQLPKISNELAELFKDQICNKVFIHCSGIYSDEVLKPLEDLGGITASAHPLQTFYYYSPTIFDKIFWVVQTKHFDKIKGIVENIGGTAIQVDFDETTRAIYHASAVAASNFLNFLLLFAKKLIAETNLNPKILIPLIEQTLQNNESNFDEINFTPLTGPIIRADIETIEKHLNGLERLSDYKEIYLLYFLSSSLLAKINGNIQDQKFATLFYKITNLLKSDKKFLFL